MMEILRLEAVNKSFHGRPIYNSASAAFTAGTITAIVGPNGSGKSILFKMICGFMLPDAGQVIVNPRFLSKGRDYPEKFGVMIDQPGFLNHLSGFANLAMLANIRREIGRDQIATTMTRFGLDPALRQRVRHYSLGMKQKLALAQAFIERPEVLILDEPFNALDEAAVQSVRTAISEFRDAGGTVIFTSHDASDVAALANSILAVRDGQLHEEATRAA